jgi:hypothetical protein
MLPRVVWYKLADVSEVLTIFIIKVTGSKHLWNVVQFLWRNVPQYADTRGLGNLRSRNIAKYCNVLGCSIHDGTLLHSKSQYTTVNYKQ